MCEIITPNRYSKFPSRENREIGSKSPNESGPQYKSDVTLSDEEIVQGLMEMSTLSLPDEPHKYYRSR